MPNDLLELAMQLSWNTKLFGEGTHPPVSEIAQALEQALAGAGFILTKK